MNRRLALLRVRRDLGTWCAPEASRRVQLPGARGGPGVAQYLLSAQAADPHGPSLAEGGIKRKGIDRHSAAIAISLWSLSGHDSVTPPLKEGAFSGTNRSKLVFGPTQLLPNHMGRRRTKFRTFTGGVPGFTPRKMRPDLMMTIGGTSDRVSTATINYVGRQRW